MGDPTEKDIPPMLDFELEDVVSVLLGVPPEEEEITVYEEDEDE